jgi:peptidoglycan-N-acetylglucosamine deacetylase
VVDGIIARGPRDRPRFAITFDDGPGGGTRGALERLAASGARATFFMVGSEVVRDPALAREVLDAGHEIGSHSMRHEEHQHAERDEAIADMLGGARAIEQTLGVEPRLYRAPYGHFAPGTLAEAEARGWTCVFWSAEGIDWREGETGTSILARILPDLGPGAIVLLHDSRRAKPTDCSPMLEAIDRLLEEARRRRLEPVTVSELLASRD